MNHTEREHLFDDWIQKYSGLLFKVIRAFAATPHDQEDLFQHVSLQLWKSIPRYSDEIAVTTWIYRVAFYSANVWKRKEKHRERRTSLLGNEDMVLMQPTKHTDPRLNSLFEQLARLSEIDRSLALMLLEGSSYREMSEVLGISESNVGVKINRIKKRIAQNLTES